ncbi:exosome complex exonuclease RRP41 [Chlorella sorokiniana]|uniref:Exosome complex exonuclease RRP41 n=1 Tax=Chlorella sorokiniana TaxID=3076 RepID=A0A2P6TG64_CHLSO|nr:exosome complex exonuclease RRP41 [Chlorella sorokiniana]|eukprot:PRW33108.1 exosome complex exonuclease RRP41 [Chlorella sorokiniana]
MSDLISACCALADTDYSAADEDKPQLLQELAELGPQLEGLAAATAAEAANLGSTKRSVLQQQQQAALYLLALLAPAFDPPPQARQLLACFGLQQPGARHSLLHRLEPEGSEQWEPGSALIAALDALHAAAVLHCEALCCAGKPPPDEYEQMDAIALAHIAALQLGQQSCVDQYCAADAAALDWQCPDGCLPVAVAAGAAAVVQHAVELCLQLCKDALSAPDPPLLAALRAEEGRQAEQGPEQQAALALCIERAKALRPCASLACPHLAANPQLRGKRDLCFQDPAAERQFRHHANSGAARVAAAAAAARTLAWISLFLRLWASGAGTPALWAALAILTSTTYAATTIWTQRLHYAATVALNVGEAGVLCHVVPSLWSASGSTAAPAALQAQAVVRLAVCNGCMWLTLCSIGYPLPFRWAFPQLAAMVFVFIHHTSAFCRSPALYPACGVPPASCGAWHVFLLLATFALVGQKLYRFDLAHRTAWHTAQRGSLPPGSQLVTDRLAYWLNFGLPAVCCIVSYSALPELPLSKSAGSLTA